MKSLRKIIMYYIEVQCLLALSASAFPQAYAQEPSLFEYVVVGSGPGGGPLAANLARQGHSVLLLEAGQDHGESDLQQVPWFGDANSEDPTMSWEFFVSHYNNTLQAQRDSKFTWRTPNGEYHIGADPPPPPGSEPLGIYYPRTGTLGGCAQHNAMNMAAPPDNDWAHIAQLTGDDGFSPENMRRLFVRMERNNYLPVGTSGHGYDGYLESNLNDMNLIAPQTGLLKIIRNAMVAGGAPPEVTPEEVTTLLRRDQNRPDSTRYENHALFQIPLHIDGRRRRSGSYTYFRDTAKAINADRSKTYPLTIKTDALVTKVLFEKGYGDKPKAIGVSYLEGTAMYSADRRYNASDAGIEHQVFATREVIIAGGVFNTPQILKLSGIGPRAELEHFGIPVIADVPAVGENMQDNYESPFHVHASRNFESVMQDCRPSEENDPCLEQWRTNFTGPYGQGAAPVGMLFRSSYSENNDADLFFFGGAGGAFLGHYPGYSRTHYPPTTFFWSVVKMQTQNRAGTVRLRSTDPRDVPEISMNFFAEGAEHDLSAIAEGLAFARRVVDATEDLGPFTYLAPKDGQDPRESTRNEAFSHHATSSCIMGADDDENACVDSKFRVRGVQGLRVVDGSVFPRVPGAFPVLPTFLLSEKATDDILAGLRE